MTKSGTTPNNTPTIQPTQGGSFVRDKASGAITQVEGPMVAQPDVELPKSTDPKPKDTAAIGSTEKPKKEDRK